MQAIILATITAATALIEWINKIRPVAQQSGEWDATTQAAFENLLLATKTDPKWQPDKPGPED